MIKTQTTMRTSTSYAWLADAARPILIASILIVLMGWFVVVGMLATATFLRSAVIGHA